MPGESAARTVVLIGATKNGALNAEAVVYFNPALADDAYPRRRRTGHAYSKMRFVSTLLAAARRHAEAGFDTPMPSG